MLGPTVSRVLLVSLLASLLPGAFSLSTVRLKQATRQQVVDRQLARRLSPLRPRQSPAPCVPPPFTGAPAGVTSTDTVSTYYGYYENSGVQENAANDGNTDPDFPPFTQEIIAPDLTIALTACANFADSDGYDSFDLSFLHSTCAWSCTIYSGVNADTLAFNVANPDVLQTYGYST